MAGFGPDRKGSLSRAEGPPFAFEDLGQASADPTAARAKATRLPLMSGPGARIGFAA
jgi:hypothetical protein